MSQKKVYLLLLLLLIVAALVRFPYADSGTYEHEKVRDIHIAEHIEEGPVYHGILGKDMPDAIQQSFGPAFYYLLYVSLSFTDSPYYYPLMPFYLAMVVSLISIILCFHFCKTYFGNRVALIASSLYALSAWIIIRVSNVSTNPNYISPLILLTFIAYYKILQDRKDTYLLLFFASIALQFHFHLSVLLMLPVYASLFLFRRDLFTKKYTYFYGLASSLLFVPFIVTLFTSTDSSVFPFIASRYASTYLTNFVEALAIPVMYVTPYLGKYLLGDYQLFSTFFFSALNYIITGVLCVIFGLSVFYLIQRVRKDSHRKPLYIPLFLWLAIPIFLAFISKTNISPHYLLMLLPVQFILMGIFLDFVIKRKKWVVYVVLFLLLYNVLFVVYFYDKIEDKGTNSLFSIPYKHKVELAHTVAELSGEHVVINYYKKPLKVITYILEIQGYEPDVHVLQDLSEFSEGVLVLNTYSFYTPLVGGLTEEEEAVLAEFDHRDIKTYDVYTLPSLGV